MKKFLSLFLSGLAVVVLSGCSVSDEGKVYYILYTNGAGVSGIDYSCDSSTHGTTNSSGSFEVNPVDSCDLDLRSNLILGDIYLEDNNGPVGNIKYDCVGNSSHANVSNWTALNGYIDNATHFQSCTLHSLP